MRDHANWARIRIYVSTQQSFALPRTHLVGVTQGLESRLFFGVDLDWEGVQDQRPVAIQPGLDLLTEGLAYEEVGEHSRRARAALVQPAPLSRDTKDRSPRDCETAEPSWKPSET